MRSDEGFDLTNEQTGKEKPGIALHLCSVCSEKHALGDLAVERESQY